MSELPLIIAHRGAPVLAPENTIASFSKALDIGAHRIGFEVDVMADGTVLVMKDDTLDRTTTGSGSYYRVGYQELRRLDAGAWFSKAYRFERVPELADVVGFLNASEQVAVMEIKASQAGSHLRERLIEGIVASLKGLTAHAEQFIAVSSDQVLLQMLHQANPDIRLGFVAGALLHSAPKIAAAMDVSVVVADEGALSEREVRTLHAAGLTVIARGVEDVQRAQQLATWKVEAILTQYPQNFAAQDLGR